MNRRFRFCPLLLAGILLAACVTRPVTDDRHQLQPGEGVVVMRLQSNWGANDGSMIMQHISWMCFRREPTIGGQIRFEMKAKDDTQVHVLKAGRYNWYGVGVTDYYRKTLPTSGFDVEAGKVTYIGDLAFNSTCLDCKINFTKWINGAGEFEVADNSATAQRLLTEKFPAYAALPFTVRLTTVQSATQGGDVVELPAGEAKSQ